MVVYRTILSLSTTCLLPRNLNEGEEPAGDQGMAAKDDRYWSCQGCLGELANKGVIYLIRLPQIGIKAIGTGRLKPEMGEDDSGIDKGGIAEAS